MDARRKFVIFLSNQDLSDPQFERLCSWLREGGLDQAIDHARRIRRMLSTLDGAAKQPMLDFSSPSVEAESRRVVQEVTRLLIDEARLSRKSAIRELQDLLPHEQRLPENLSFDKALTRLIDGVGEGRILSAAHEVRNRRIHQRNDWPLKGGMSETTS